MVSEKRTRAGDGNLQRRDQRRRDHYSAARTVDLSTSRMAMGVCAGRRTGIRMAGNLDGHVPKAGRALAVHGRRTQIHPERLQSARGENAVGPVGALPADVDICSWKIPDRSHLVVLPFLDSGLHAAAARLAVKQNRAADFCHLSDLRHWERCWRMDFVNSAAARFFRECLPEMGDARMRDLCCADRGDLSCLRIMAGDSADWARGGGTSGVFRKPFYADV